MATSHVRESPVRLLDVFCFRLRPLFLSDLAADLFPRGSWLFSECSKLSVERRPFKWCSCEPRGRALDRPLVEKIWPQNGAMWRCGNVSRGQRHHPRHSCCDRKPYCCGFTDRCSSGHCGPFDYTRLGYLP